MKIFEVKQVKLGKRKEEKRKYSNENVKKQKKNFKDKF